MNIRKKIHQLGWKKIIYTTIAGYFFLSILFEFSAYRLISSSVDNGFSDIHSKMERDQKYLNDSHKEMDDYFEKSREDNRKFFEEFHADIKKREEEAKRKGQWS